MFALFIFTLAAVAPQALAQSTAFVYQGSLDEAGAPANGAYDFEFTLHDQEAGGAQLGPLVSASGVQIQEGGFAVDLDFGNEYTGAPRWLQIRIKPGGADPAEFVTLAPRQRVGSVPYSVRSLATASAESAADAQALGGVAASQYVVTTDPRLSDARAPLPGSSAYVQNGTVQQAASNFHVSGTGAADVFDAGSEYRLNGIRVLDVGQFNSLFVGANAGTASTASNNTFVGSIAGELSETGSENTFVGALAGANNVGGDSNSLFGYFAGQTLVSGSNNAFFGHRAGNGNTGSNNAIFGGDAGRWSSAGSNNTIIGANAGNNPNGNGSNNTLLGADTSSGGTMNYATALGAGVAAWKSNSVQIGRPEDDVRVSGDLFLQGGLVQITTGNLAIGGVAPTHKLEVVANSGNIIMGDAGCPSGSTAIGFGNGFGNCERYYLRGSTTSNDLWINRPTGGAIRFREGNGTTSQIVIEAGGQARFAFPVIVSSLGAAGGTALCRNGNNEISTCSSSIRYKSEVEDFSPGYDLIEKLRPVSFKWNGTGDDDLGLVAEEVEEVAPMLVTYGAEGQVEGVKYDRLGAVLVNVVKEQHDEIAAQRAQIDRLGALAQRQSEELSALKSLLCDVLGDAPACAGQ